MIVEINNQEIEVVVQRKRNKNMYLRVKEGHLLVTAHPSVPLENIQEFVLSRKEWIESVIENQEEKKRKISKGIEGPIIYLLGEKKYVRYVRSNKNYVELNEDILTFYLKEEDNQLILSTFNQFAKPLLMKILMIQKERWDRVIQDYNIHELPSIKIRTMVSQWGNCMPQKSAITMNLSLIHFPLECIDYVLWHEYVHLLVPNHSKRFYEIVEYHMPEYKKYRNMLK